ncbi:TPA: hypothetical protein L3360_001241 [Escherichia coli]|nr:hypothetical protein [Escherichia coli]
MTTPITKELREHAEENVKALRLAVKQHAFKDIRDAIEMDLKVAEFALAAMDAEPVAVINGAREPVLYGEHIGIAIGTHLYTAPPAPVSVPDEVIVLLNHLEDVLPDDAFNLIDVKTWNNVSMLSRPDVYRAAMLQAGNSPVVPDGWQLVPVEPTENMLDAAYSFPASTEDRMRKQYVAMLAAAPQQEVK